MNAVRAVTEMRPQVRVQISKDYMLEDEEIRGEVRERLERMHEGVRMLESGDSDSDDEEESSGEY